MFVSKYRKQVSISESMSRLSVFVITLRALFLNEYYDEYYEYEVG